MTSVVQNQWSITVAAADAYEEWYTNGDSGRVATVRYICRPSSDDMIRIATKALYDDKCFKAI